MSSTNFGATPESLLRQEVLDLQAYPVSDSTGMVKLDAMENPYSLPQSLREELSRLVADVAINRYPDADAQRLKASIRAVTGLPQGLDILLGNGSDEIIQLLALAVAKPNATLLSVEPSFVMYKNDRGFYWDAIYRRAADRRFCAGLACHAAGHATTSTCASVFVLSK